ncbi:MAG: AraC family transcriptional regulator [Rhizobiaceae bacterium]|nr:AraC family transcriptional regulator [Rhizobiaceae bacterium]
MHVTSSHLSDFTEAVGSHFRPHEVDGPDRIVGNLEARHFGKVGLTYLSYGSEVAIKTDPLEGFSLLQIPIKGSSSEPGRGGRERFSLQSAQVLGLARSIDFAMHRNCTLLITRFENADIADTLAALSDNDDTARTMMAMARCDLASPAGRSLFSQLQWLSFELEDEGSSLARMEAHCSKSLLVSFVMATVPSLSKQTTRLPTIAAVRRVEAYVDEYFGESITVADMARVAGVPVRTLFELFRRYSDETPSDLLRRKRLEAVRRVLVEASADETTVTDVAMACGFAHLGRFAQYYRAAYGEKPSDTLLRRMYHS